MTTSLNKSIKCSGDLIPILFSSRTYRITTWDISTEMNQGVSSLHRMSQCCSNIAMTPLKISHGTYTTKDSVWIPRRASSATLTHMNLINAMSQWELDTEHSAPITATSTERTHVTYPQTHIMSSTLRHQTYFKDIDWNDANGNGLDWNM